MRESATSSGARVVKVAAGLESSDRHVPVRDLRHEALGVLIGKGALAGQGIEEWSYPGCPPPATLNVTLRQAPGVVVSAATGPQLASIWAATPAHEPEAMNKPGSIIAAVAGIAVLSGFGLTHHHTATATHTATAAVSTVHPVSHTPAATAAHLAAARRRTPPRTRPPPTRPWYGWPQPAARPRSRSTTRSPPSPPTSKSRTGRRPSPTTSSSKPTPAPSAPRRTRSSPPRRCSRPSTGPPTSTC